MGPATRVRLAVPLVLLAIAAPRPGEAQGTEADAAIVAIPSVAASPELASRALAPVAAALKTLSGRGLVLPHVAVHLLAGGGGQQRLEDAARRSARAREAVRAFEDLDRAAALLEDAIARHLELLPLLDDVGEPLALLRELATVRLALGDGPGLEAALAEAARLDPELSTDPRRDPERLRAAADRVRRELGGEPPLLSPELAGRYAELLGVRRVAVARFEGPGRIRVDVYHRNRAERTATLELDPTEVERSARELGEALGIAVDRPGRRGRSAARADTDAPDGSARPEPRGPAPWYRSWWFWTTVGVAVAGAVTVTAIVATSGAE